MKVLICFGLAITPLFGATAQEGSVPKIFCSGDYNRRNLTQQSTHQEDLSSTQRCAMVPTQLGGRPVYRAHLQLKSGFQIDLSFAQDPQNPNKLIPANITETKDNENLARGRSDELRRGPDGLLQSIRVFRQGTGTFVEDCISYGTCVYKNNTDVTCVLTYDNDPQVPQCWETASGGAVRVAPLQRVAPLGGSPAAARGPVLPQWLIEQNARAGSAPPPPVAAAQAPVVAATPLQQPGTPIGAPVQLHRRTYGSTP